MIALVANPDSGSGEADEVADEIRGLGAQVRRFDLGDVEAAIGSCPARLVVAGGDGSVACVAAPAGRAGIPFGVIPTGTANDFARALGIPLDVPEAAGVAVRSERTRRIDLGHMDDRPFVNVASLGLSPAAAERSQELKSKLGAIAYTVGALRAGIEADPVTCRVLCDGEPLFSGAAWQVTVACTGAFGGGSSVEADPGDGALDVVAIEAGSRTRLIRHAYGFRAGEVEGQRGVHSLRCRSARIVLEEEHSFNVDGEVVRSGSCEFAAEPAAVEVVVP